MTKLGQLARPVMRGRAGLHADEAGWQLPEKLDDLPAPQLPGDHRLARRVDAVHLEHVLGEIQTDRANLHVDGPFM